MRLLALMLTYRAGVSTGRTVQPGYFNHGPFGAKWSKYVSSGSSRVDVTLTLVPLSLLSYNTAADRQRDGCDLVNFSSTALLIYCDVDGVATAISVFLEFGERVERDRDLRHPSPRLLPAAATHFSLFSTHPGLRGQICVVRTE
ncbi:hypothetical protein E1301_Tti014229 [Triplophysa tibetana]|uniref:Uncharacterized protein n=1 Tax=Triplophysa tibetana TaxID=1572043 RepID=A0A5A9N1J3_9TELE|nr:hypothetical protein E1301_Tti014229 [Triplophysa tibetana]